jgi:hypothetical protein
MYVMADNIVLKWGHMKKPSILLRIALIQRWMETMMEIRAKDSLINGSLLLGAEGQPSEIMVLYRGVVSQMFAIQIR